MSDSSPGPGETFLDDGFDDANLRANATFATGIGFLHLAAPTRCHADMGVKVSRTAMVWA